MHFFVVVPYSRPRFAKTVWDNFQRQTWPNKTLVVVENGPAVGTWRYPSTIVLRSAAHQSHAKNEALRQLRSQGGAYVSIFDDDDYYGPKYLEEIATEGALPNFEIVGKVPHFVYEPRGLFLIQPEFQHLQRDWVRGGSMTFHTNKVGNFPVEESEDVKFCTQVLDKGGHIYSNSIHHCCYMRDQSDHTYTDNVVDVFRKHRMPVHFIGKKLDFDIINGKRPWKYHP